jgi:hypothetical protein
MKINIIAFILVTLAATSCQKPDPVVEPTPQTPVVTPVVLKGGKGGNFSIVAFSKQNSTWVNARIFMKYAANVAPADTNAYDEKYTAVPEPGFGSHAHFDKLTTGTYFIRALYNTKMADTLIEIKDSTAIETDITLQVK